MDSHNTARKAVQRSILTKGWHHARHCLLFGASRVLEEQMFGGHLPTTRDQDILLNFLHTISMTNDHQKHFRSSLTPLQ
jgi:hypothetical protein